MMAIDTASKVHDSENQSGAVELEPLLNQDEADEEVDGRTGSPTERPRIGEIPSVHKPGYGNWMWAEQQCARRCGFTIAEAKLVQEAQSLYQDGGDPKAFLIEMFSAFILMEEDYLRSTHDSRKLPKLPYIGRFVESWLIVVSPSVALAWGGMKVALSSLNSDFREAYENRVHLMETMSRLLPIVTEIFEPDRPETIPLQKGSSDLIARESPVSASITPSTQQPPNPDAANDSVSAKTVDRRGVWVEGANASKRAGKTTTSDPSTLSGDKRIEDLKKALVAGHFDLTKLDQKKFTDVIKELLSSRSLGQMRGDPATGYIIVGWFPRGSLNPREKLLRFNERTDIFKQMRRTIRSVRGWRRFLSLKSLHSFGLYKCDIPRGAHVKINLSAQERSIMSHFIVAYKASYRHPDADVAKAWAAWVQKELNANSLIMFEGKYSLELIYSWSAVRLSVAVITPTLFSFAVGLGYMIKTGDVSTAWTISSYIVTAAGALVALLAILGSLKDS